MTHIRRQIRAAGDRRRGRRLRSCVTLLPPGAPRPEAEFCFKDPAELTLATASIRPIDLCMNGGSVDAL